MPTGSIPARNQHPEPQVSGATRVAAVIGHPVGHSLSPALHNAAFTAARLDWVYVAFDVAPGRSADAMTAMRSLGLGGLSVTMPHKADIIDALDELAPSAAALGAVNTVVVGADGKLVGHNTDGAGFVDSLAASGVPVVGRRVVLLGAGGAARALADALGRSGAAAVIVVNRSAPPAERCAALAGVAGAVGGPEHVASADLVVNATPLGMGDDPALPCDPRLLHRGQVVADLVYHPLQTPLLVAARTAGAIALDGLGMLVHQAARQQVLWTGVHPRVAVMRAAALAELARRHGG